MAIAIHNAKLYGELQSELGRRTAVEADLRKSVQAATESEHRLRTLLDSVRVGILIVDQETRRILDVNPAALQLLRTTREAVVGKVCHGFVCSANANHCPVCDLGQEVDNAERIALRADGSMVPVLKTVVRVTLDGRPCLLENFVSIEEQKQTEKALAEQTAQLEAIGTVTTEITRELDLARLLDLLVRRAMSLIGVQSGTVFLWEEASQSLVSQASVGLLQGSPGIRLQLGEGVAGSVAVHREGILVNDFATSPFANHGSQGQEGIARVVAEPLLYHDRLVGVMVLGDRTDDLPFEVRDQAMLRLFASEQEIKEWEAKYRKGGTGYGDVKKRLVELTQAFFAPYRPIRKELEDNPGKVEKILLDGAQRARVIARKTINEVREAVGLKAM